MRHLHLEYGAIDMRLTPEGDYVFLEINPNGEYLYVEQATGLPISRALAEHLQRGRPTRQAPVGGAAPASDTRPPGMAGLV
jgi:hypothetical protein